MTIRTMPRVLLALCVLLAAPACRQARASRSGPSARDKQIAARLDTLEQKVENFGNGNRHLSRLVGKAWGRIAALADRLDSVVAVLAGLKTKVAAGTAATRDSASKAAAAASQAGELAKQLAVLEKRLDYHLRHDQGAR